MKKKITKPSTKEDRLITAAALSDPNNQPLTDAEWNRVKPLIKRGRPLGSGTKAQITLRLDIDVIDALRASGAGWQTRVNEILRRSVLR